MKGSAVMVQIARICLFLTILTVSVKATVWRSLKPMAEFRKLLEEKNRILEAEAEENPEGVGRGIVSILPFDEHHEDMLLVKKLRNSVVKVAARPIYPYIVLRNETDSMGKNITTLTGFVGDIWSILEKQFGFKTELHLLASRRTSYVLVDWDVLLNPQEFTMNATMRRYTRSTFPITRIWYNVFMKGKYDSSFSWFYFQILDDQLWVIILVSIVALSGCLWVVWKARSCTFTNFKETPKDTNYVTCFLSILGCMVNQGSQIKGESTLSIKIVTLASILLGFFITTSFSALLISKLATVDSVRAETLDFDSVLTSPGHLTFCVAKNGFAYKKLVQIYSHNRSEAHHRLNGHRCTKGDFDYVPAEDYCGHNVLVLETKFNANHALDEAPARDYSTCPALFIYKTRLFETHLSLTFRHDFPYLRLINKRLLRMEESGILRNIEKKWKPVKKQTETQETAKYTPSVSFDHVKTIVLLCGAAVGVSLLILAIELLVHNWPQRYSLRCRL